MAGKTALIKNFYNDKGLDLRSSEIVREPSFASGMLNSDYRKTGPLNKRKGFQHKTNSVGGFGESIYANVNLTTGVITPERVVVDSKLHKMIENSMTVAYSGSDHARISIYLDADEQIFKCEILDNEVSVLDMDLGIGINEEIPVTVADLVAAIDALANFSATATVATDTPAAFIDITRDMEILAAGITINYYSYTAINTPLASPLATTQTNITSDEFENASFVNLQNILYIATGYDELHKYDGQTFYRAGMPLGATPSVAFGAATGITDTTINYKITYIQKDAKGNVIEGILSAASGNLSPANQDINVTITNILAPTGFNTNCGIVNGIQAGVTTLTVDAGHTLKVGDVAYFYNTATSAYVERTITTIGATTITFAGVVSVADNAVISNNLRIGIWRNTNAGTTYSLVAEIPNNSLSATQVYNDTLATAGLGANYTPPVKAHGLPPKGRYITAFRNQLIVTGKLDGVNLFDWSEPGEPEYFPSGDNSESVTTASGDKIKGVAPLNNALFIFKDTSLHVVSGNLIDGQYRVDRVVGDDIGCVSHHSIQEVKGRLFFLSKQGVFALSSGDTEPTDASFRVAPIITSEQAPYIFQKAIALNWPKKNKYILHLPAEEADSSGELYMTPSSTILVFDYSRGAWLQWDTLNLMGGMSILNDKLFFTSRRLDTFSEVTEYQSGRIEDNGTSWDYADHHEGIVWEHKSHWEAMGEPDVKKKFLRVTTFSLNETVLDFEQEAFSMTMTAESDYVADSPQSVSILDFSVSGWGVFEWGVDPWGSNRKLKKMTKLKSFSSKAMRLVYSNSTIHENVLLTGWTIEAAAPFDLKMKK